MPTTRCRHETRPIETSVPKKRTRLGSASQRCSNSLTPPRTRLVRARAPKSCRLRSGNARAAVECPASQPASQRTNEPMRPYLKADCYGASYAVARTIRQNVASPLALFGCFSSLKKKEEKKKKYHYRLGK